MEIGGLISFPTISEEYEEVHNFILQMQAIINHPLWDINIGNMKRFIGTKAYKDSEKSGREYERVVRYVESILEDEKNEKEGE